MGLSRGENRPRGVPSPRRSAFALTLAHGVNDMYMGFLPGLLPLLADRLDLSLTRVGVTVTIIGVVSNFLQPAFGHVGDRVGRRALVVAGPVVTALSMSLLGLVNSYQALLVALVVGGMGNAAFHPAAASLAGGVARGRSSVMAFFVGGGNLGYGCGPLAVIAFVGLFGMERTWLTATAGLAVALFVAVSVPASGRYSAPKPAPAEGGRMPAWVGPMIVLYLVMVLRAAAAIVFVTFVPMLYENRGEPLALGGFTLLAFSLAGATGGLLAGAVVPRLGRRRITVLTMVLAAGAFLLFLHSRGIAAGAMTMIMGACLFAALPVNIMMAQQLLPAHATAASGLVMGAAWALGSLAATGVGALADLLGRSAGTAEALGQAMAWSVVLLLAAALLAGLLPRQLEEEAAAPQAG